MRPEQEEGPIVEALAAEVGVPFIEDPSNTDISYMRNYIRHEMMPKVLKVNPGIKKTVRKLMDKRGVYAHGSSSAGSSGG